MKRILRSVVMVYVLILTQNVVAQETDEAKTLFGKGSILNAENIGLFAAPSFGFTSMDGGSAFLYGLRGGVLFDDKFSLGAYYSTSLNDINPESETVRDVYLDYWSIGGFTEFTLLSNRVVHVTFPLYFGYGEVELDNEMDDVRLGESNFFQIEPSALLEVNLHKYVRLNLGVGYRFVGEMEYRNMDQSDISGVTGYMGLKFGLFK